MEEKEYNQRVEELVNKFPGITKPVEQSAKLAEKIFSLIGELQGETIGLRLNLRRKE